MSFMAFCAGESAIMLCMRVWLSAVFVFGVSLFDHGVVALSVKITFATLSVLHGVVKHAIFAGVYR